MSAISGLMVGTQYFQGRDAPRYVILLVKTKGIASDVVADTRQGCEP
jgi:hypothetical protein